MGMDPNSINQIQQTPLVTSANGKAPAEQGNPQSTPTEIGRAHV